MKATRDSGRPRVAYVLRSYPRLSQTFVLNEILALERLGLELVIFGMIDPRERLAQPGVAAVRAPVHYLEAAPAPASVVAHLAALGRSPRRYLATAAYVLRRRDLDRGYTTASRRRCFGAAVRLARAARRAGVTHLHSHFAHDPTLVALLVKRLTGLPFSFTAHARDLYQTPVPALAERVRESTAVVTCCAANVAYLDDAVPAARAKLHLVHHGIDLAAFAAGLDRDDEELPLVLSVGRLVEKKGFADLIEACRLLAAGGNRFRCLIYGEGPLRADLEARIGAAGLAGRVLLAGARTQDELAREYRRAAVFALTPIVTGDGDRDGIPNVLLEAMACGLPVVSTTAGGIAEVVLHGQTGLLAGPGDARAVASHLARLLADPDLRASLGAHGRRQVATHFDAARSAARIAQIVAPKELRT